MYLSRDDLDRAESHFKQGLTHSRQMSWKEGVVSSSIHISLIGVLKNQNIRGAKELLKEALRGAEELHHPELRAKAYLVQSKILALEKKVEESQLVFKNAHKIIGEHNLSQQIQDFEKKVVM